MGDRHALVAGVSGPTSIGWAIALRFREQGARVTVASRPSRGDVVGPLARAHGIGWRPLVIDRPDTVKALFDEPVDALVHTLVHVPRGLDGPLVDLPTSELELALSTPATSLVTLCAAALPHMRDRPHPRIVALSSTLAERPAPAYHALGIGKAALEATVRYLALELGPAGILCNALRFALIPTAGASAAIGHTAALAARDRITRRCATRTETTPKDVASAAAWLCSPEASNLTGQVITVDGGFGFTYS